MKKICTRCRFTGKGKHGLFSGNIYIATAQVSLGIALIAFNFNFVNLSNLDWAQIFILVVAVLSIIVGILNFIDSRKPGLVCPRCSKPGMLDVDSDAGQTFISENNIQLPG